MNTQERAPLGRDVQIQAAAIGVPPRLGQRRDLSGAEFVKLLGHLSALRFPTGFSTRMAGF
jgi:hypothetical protein